MVEPRPTPRQPDADPADAADVFTDKLRSAGLLGDAEPSALYRRWLENAARRGVEIRSLILIAREQELGADGFAVLDGLEELVDRNGKSFFLLPRGLTATQARRAVLMTYVLNAGTDYGKASRDNDFDETPYSEQEVARIVARQRKNGWSYDDAAAFVDDHGGRLVTTPNGMLMGLGGSWISNRFSLNGGTTWGDVFLLNVDGPSGDAAAQVLRDMIPTGVAWYEFDDGRIGAGRSRLDLDRLLHHEEIHSQQWARLGRTRFATEYLGSGALGWVRSKAGRGDARNRFEQEAGLRDGGYR
ncbi:hypothetical protein CLV56_1263 [Mumia flava]|uniref:DUF4157 domain-containing protein n=1 Tax=Mumia flava TaxID=1348852 RepID=A0A2M9BGL3_9ACTN|nr:hypothetical protein [Mumia flava]PJJ57044.1 hypothetical protein CLV56_1263 [Mumia flava]